MKTVSIGKITSLLQLFERLPENERIIVDVLRQIVIENLPIYCKEKFAFNVPYFYGNKAFALSGLLPFPGVVLNKVCCWVFSRVIN